MNGEKKYATRDHEAGNLIDRFATLKEAIKAVDSYIADDKIEENYIPDFYEVYNLKSAKEEYIA